MSPCAITFTSLRLDACAEQIPHGVTLSTITTVRTLPIAHIMTNASIQAIPYCIEIAVQRQSSASKSSSGEANISVRDNLIFAEEDEFRISYTDLVQPSNGRLWAAQTISLLDWPGFENPANLQP